MNRRAAIACFAATVGTPTLLRAQTATKVRATAISTDTAAMIFYAKDQGYFDRTGLDVDVSISSNGSAGISALAGGAVDVCYSAILAAEEAFHKGLPIQILAAACVADTTHGRQLEAVLVGRNSPITTVKDFEGKTLATAPLKGSGDLPFNAWAAARGADPSKFRWVEIPGPALVEALTQGRIDAASTTEPYTTLGLKDTRIFCHPFSAVAKRFATGAFFVNPTWANANRDVARRLKSALQDAATWANKNQAQSGQILQKYSHVDPSIIAAMARASYAQTTEAGDIQPTIDFLAKNGILDASFRAQNMIYSLQ